MTVLSAEARFPTAAGGAHIAALCERLAGFDLPTRHEGDRGRVELPDGRGAAILVAEAGALSVRAEAETEQGLSALKFMLGLYLEKVAEAEKPEIVWTGHGCDAAVLPSLREMRVRRIADVTPHVRRITLTGQDLGRFESQSLHVRLLFPPKGLAVPEWPKPGKNGRPVWPEDERRPASRVYTIRRVDAAAGELDIDFVLHEAPGIASDWARGAREGDLVGLMGPGGREAVPARWRLLAGDETAIPAMARILEALPAEAEGLVLIEAEDAREVQDLAHPPGMQVRWLFRNGAEPGRNTILADAVMAVDLPDHDDLFCWLGAEEATARRIRSFWREERGIPRKKHLCVGYWRHAATPEGEAAAA